jgi:hypothetical protein
LTQGQLEGCHSLGLSTTKTGYLPSQLILPFPLEIKDSLNDSFPMLPSDALFDYRDDDLYRLYCAIVVQQW